MLHSFPLLSALLLFSHSVVSDSLRPTLWSAAYQPPVLHCLPELLRFMSIESVMPSNHLILCCPLLLLPSIFPSIFSNELSLHIRSDGQNIRASVSVLTMNMQGWFPLGWTGWISLLSKGLWRSFSSTTVSKHQFFGAEPSLWSNSHIHTWLLERP